MAKVKKIQAPHELKKMIRIKIGGFATVEVEEGKRVSGVNNPPTIESDINNAKSDTPVNINILDPDSISDIMIRRENGPRFKRKGM